MNIKNSSSHDLTHFVQLSLEILGIILYRAELCDFMASVAFSVHVTPLPVGILLLITFIPGSLLSSLPDSALHPSASVLVNIVWQQTPRAPPPGRFADSQFVLCDEILTHGAAFKFCFVVKWQQI